MTEYNQYYSDERFDGKEIYSQINKTNLNDYQKYNSREYYDLVNKSFSNLTFPEKYADESFESICSPSEYSLKNQQKFVGRIINTHVENNGMLIYHGLGSGKTQTSIVVGEAFKYKTVLGKRIPGRTPVHVLVIVPASLTDQYYSEIIGYVDNKKVKSASGEIVIFNERQFYISTNEADVVQVLLAELETSLKEKRSLEESKSFEALTRLNNKIIRLQQQLAERKSTLKRKVETVYEIVGHETFLNRLFKIENKQFIQNEYIEKLQNPNSLLIIDEAHRLVSAVGTNYRKLLLALTYEASSSQKTILLTGSPIYDKPYELGLLLNLLRPRVPFPDGKEKFDEIFIDSQTNSMINKEVFRQMVSGYVSYFKGGNPNAYPYKKIITMNHFMNTYQYSRYKNALFKELEKDSQTANKLGNRNYEDFLYRFTSTESATDELSSSVFNNSRLYCNIVFPEVTDNSTIKNREGLLKAGLDMFKRELAKTPQNQILTKVTEYSSKFASVIGLIEKSEGTVFVYSNYVYYGVESMAIILESLGYTRYPKRSSKTFFVWKGGEKKDLVQAAKNLFNSEENADGSKIKIILGTQSTMEGVDFKRVRDVHILDPWWNDSRMQQVMARAVRLCSHKGLPESKRIVNIFIHLSELGSREKIFKVVYKDSEGKEQKVYSTLTPLNPIEKDYRRLIFSKSVPVVDKTGELMKIKEITNRQIKAADILSIERGGDLEILKQYGSWKSLDSISVEQYMYKKALSKLYINRQFEQVLKDCSIDCTLNKNGNILRLDEKYEPYVAIDGTYMVYYENYSNGKKYQKRGIKSKENKNLPDSVVTMGDILSNVAKNTDSNSYTDLSTGDVIKMDSSLIVSEDNDCKAGMVKYSFESLPGIIQNLTLNYQLIPSLKQMDIKEIKEFFYNIEKGIIKVKDKLLPSKIKKFYSKASLEEKEKVMNELVEYGFDIELLELENVETLKKILIQIKNSRK